MRIKKYFIIISILLVVGIAYYFFRPQPQPEDKYIIDTVQQGTIRQTVSVTGQALSRERVDLAFEINGRLKENKVKVGDYVKKGDVIAVLDSSYYWQKYREAEENRIIAQNNLDLARRKWDDLKPEEKAAKKASVRVAEAEAQAVKSQLSKTILRAPQDGLVVEVKNDPGETVTANVPIISIIKENIFEIDVDVPESDIAKVKLGQEADLTFDAFGSQKVYRAKVYEIEPSATVIQDVIYYKVKLAPQEEIKNLRDGLSADADILIQQKENVLKVPLQAIKNEGEKQYVEELLPNNQIKKVYVKTGIEGDQGNIEILSGLQKGEKIIIASKEKE